jgi:hypothetical protein
VVINSLVDVLTHPMLWAGIVAGLVVLGVGIVASTVSDHDDVLRSGGLLVAGATVLVLLLAGQAGISQLLGVALLAGAGLFHRSVAVGALLAVPGAFLVVRPDASQSWIPWFAMAAVVLAAPLVTAFDDRYYRTGLPLPLFGIAAFGVFLTVPDTEGAMVLLGVAGLAGFLGWPRPLNALGPSGAYAAVGIYVFVASEGALARPASIIAAIAVLGLLLLVPIVGRVRGVGWAHDLDGVDAVFPLIAQLLLVLLISRTAGRMPGVEAAAALTVSFLAAAGVIMMRRPAQLTD